MANDELALYRRWLACGLKQENSQEKNYVQESFAETIQQSSAYQSDALVNGNPQPIVATRKDTNKCDVTVIPGDKLCIGDLVKVFNEYWICVELYVDEFGMCYGELWMCNHIFHYQDFELNIIHKYAILDDGSYSKGNDKALAVTDNSFNCYVSLDDESRALYIDKRLGISVIYDKDGKEVLEVGKIKWIDITSRNFGEGSHLMVFGINDDPFNPETDNIDLLICDYQAQEDDDEQEETVEVKGELVISGRNTIRSGSGRTYSLSAIDKKSGQTIEAPSDVDWQVECDGVTITPNGATCKVTVKEDDDLIGTIFTITCVCATDEYTKAEFNVEVT